MPEPYDADNTQRSDPPHTPQAAPSPGSASNTQQPPTPRAPDDSGYPVTSHQVPADESNASESSLLSGASTPRDSVRIVHLPATEVARLAATAAAL